MTASAVLIDLGDQFLQHLCGLVVGDLAGAGGVMATTAIAQHQRADIGLAVALEDGLAAGEHRVLLLHAHIA